MDNYFYQKLLLVYHLLDPHLAKRNVNQTKNCNYLAPQHLVLVMAETMPKKLWVLLEQL